MKGPAKERPLVLPLALLLFLLSFLLLGLASCKQVLLWRYGIHNPRVETPESIREFLKRMEVPDENIFICRDSSAFFTCLSDTVFRENLLGTLFFSPQGLMNRFKDTTACQWSGGFFIGRLKADTLYGTDTAYTFPKLMERFTPLSPRTRIDTAGAGFLAVVSWGCYLGTYSKRLFSVREAAGQQKKVTVKTVFLCMDMLEGWNLTREQQKSYAIK